MSAARGQRRDDVTMAEVGRVITSVAARFARAWRKLDQRDLEAEAWQACLAAWGGFNPASGPAEAYFRVIARRAMGRFCSRMVAQVSMGKRLDLAKEHQSKVDIQEWNHGEVHSRAAGEVEERLGEHPEGVALREERERMREARREQIRRLVGEAIEGWHKWDRFVALRLTGLDGYPIEKPRELAARLRVNVARAYKIHARLERAIWGSPALYKLAKEDE